MGALDTALAPGYAPASCIYLPSLRDGLAADQHAAAVLNIIVGIVSVLSLIYYAWHSFRSTCGWEEVYVAIVELVKVALEIFFEACSPISLTLLVGGTTPHVVWVRYAEWLCSCPVLLIHLSNLTGLADDYSHRTMALLVSDIGTIVFGISAAFTTGWIKILCFCIGAVYGAFTLSHAAAVHQQAFFAMPRGACRSLVKWMALAFFVSWCSYPVLFMLGPEGFFNVLSPWWSVAAHAVADLLSKNLWGFLGHHLRIKVHEHVLQFGLIRQRRKHSVCWGLFELEVDTLVADAPEPGAVRGSVAGLAGRSSFRKMAANMQAQGHQVTDLTAFDSLASGAGGVDSPSQASGSEWASWPRDASSSSQFFLGSPAYHRTGAATSQRRLSQRLSQRVHPGGASRLSAEFPGAAGSRPAKAARASDDHGSEAAPAGGAGHDGSVAVVRAGAGIAKQ